MGDADETVMCGLHGVEASDCYLCALAAYHASVPSTELESLRARLRDAEAREKRYREALELLERRYGQDPDARTHHDNCQHVDCIARRALTSPVDLGGPTPGDSGESGPTPYALWIQAEKNQEAYEQLLFKHGYIVKKHRSRHRVGYVSMGLPCFYCTAEAGEECRDEPDKRTPPPSTKGP